MPETARASFEELKDFCNRVREAGGGNALHALIPSVPQDTSQCLIARNLNFNCEVSPSQGLGYNIPRNKWVMVLRDEETRDRISEALDLEAVNSRDSRSHAIVLPDEIAQVARDFDDVQDLIWETIPDVESIFGGRWDRKTVEWVVQVPDDFDWTAAAKKSLESLSDEDRQMIVEFLPYMETADEDARKLASLVNEDGSIVV